ncbi:MAG: 16S rRNA (uracil(1498)-N(3))-methyltransferase [Syntrophothermus sp.]
MPRFFVEPRRIVGGEVRITGNDVNHIARVLRLGPGDRITVLDGTGMEHEVEISSVSGQEVCGRIAASRRRQTEPRFRVTLIQGLPKAGKMDLIVQKCTEIGVARILPARMERSVVELEGARAAARVERWRKIAMEAAEQSGRAVVPVIGEVTTMAGVLDSKEFREAMESGRSLALMPWEGEDSMGLRRALEAGQDRRPETAWLFIGPEGGFSLQEVENARAAGVITVSLGPRILRTETAGFVALTLLLWEAGDLDAGPI